MMMTSMVMIMIMIEKVIMTMTIMILTIIKTNNIDDGDYGLDK